MDATAQDLIQRLRRNPDDSEAFAALRAHYHRQGDFASLVNLLEGWAARHADGGHASAAFYEAGEIVRTYMHDRGRAMSLYERALDRNGLHMDASIRLQEMLEELGEHRRLLDLLERRAEALTQANADPRHVAQVHQQIGEVWEHRFQRVDRAIHHYRKAFDLDPTLVQAIYAAREIYRNAGNLKAAASLYDLEANAETDPDRKVALLRELGHLRGEQLNDVEGAIVALKRALNQAPTDLSVMHEVATLLLRRADRSADPEAAETDRRRAADLLFQMAQAVPPDHGVAYAEAALDASPDHDGALELLEVLAPQIGREDLLPIRWVGYLQSAPGSPAADRMRRALGNAYLTAGQIEDAIVCFEPLLERGDAEAAERLVALYREAGREADVVHALSIAVSGLPPDKRIPHLREIIDILKSQGNADEAAARAKEILAIDPADPEALTFLEDHLRKQGALEALRDLLLAAARVPGLSVESRKLRLREVANLCETKLDDRDGAISAWRGVNALDPADPEARRSLERLLEQAERWDELVQVLEREALTVTDPELKGELYKRLARIHSVKRNSLMEAIEALRHLRDIRPGDLEARDSLCDALIDAGAYLEAVPLLRQRVDGASGKEERVRLLRTLSAVLEEHIGDDEGAFEGSAKLLDEEPGDLDALSRMERIDRRNEEWQRLVETLSYRVEVAEPEERAGVYAEMGSIADQHLHALDRAAEYYGQAMELAPGDGAVLDALCSVYDRAERYRDLVVLLRERAQDEEDGTARAELYRRIARTLADRVRNEDAAAEAWEEVLTIAEDEEALRFLASLAVKRNDPVDLAERLGRLERLVEDETERRDMLMQRAVLLADRLDRKTEAIEVLERVLATVDEAYLPALSRLSALAEETGDRSKLSTALERQLRVVEDDGLRVPLAERLANLYEHELDDRPRAIDALYAWADADLTDPEPQRRLIGLLGRAERWEDLVTALDSLAGIEQDDAIVGDLVRRASKLCVDEIGDVDGAWERLVPRVEDGDTESEQQLRELAREAARGEALAELYVRMAQAAEDVVDQHRRWMDAADVFRVYLDDPARALEAALRAFAVDLADEGTLDEVDRLAVAAKAWERLTQVYDTLLRRTEDDAVKAKLLLRHAALVDREANDPSFALDRVMRACSLAPDDDTVLERAETLAPRAERAEELLIVYDRRRQRAEEDGPRVAALLRAARLCDLSMGDRARAMQYVTQAVALAARSPDTFGQIEALVRELDEERPELGPQAARRALIETNQKLAERAAEDDPENGARLLVWAGRLMERELEDEEGAFRYLQLAATYAPGEGKILDELEELAERNGRFDDLARRLKQLIEEALDQSTAAELLKRRGRILEVELERYSEAADVYAQLLAMRTPDLDVPHRLRSCLRRAGRHQDLLGVLDREIERTRMPDRQVELLKEVASVWEDDLKNRWEALDAWKRVLAIAPDDDDATDAVKRLGHSTRKLSADELAASLESHEAESDELPEPPDGAPGPMPPSPETGEFTDPGILTPGSSLFSIDDETESEEDDSEVAQAFRALDDEGTDEESGPAPAKPPPEERDGERMTAPITGYEATILAGEEPTDLRDQIDEPESSTSELDLIEHGIGTEDEDEDDLDPSTVDEPPGAHGDPVAASSLAELGDHFDDVGDETVDGEIDEFDDVEMLEAGEDVSDEEDIEELASVEILEEDEDDDPLRAAPPRSVPPPPPPDARRSSSVPPPLPPLVDDDEDDINGDSMPPPINDR